MTKEKSLISENGSLQNTKCVYTIHGDDYISGTYYKCFDCFSSSSHAICPDCAKICHADHNLTTCSGSYFCDCGAGIHKTHHCLLCDNGS